VVQVTNPFTIPI